MVRIAGALFFLAATISSSSAANCLVPNIHLIPDVTVTGYMYVKSGKRCSIVPDNSPGGTQGVDITQRPSNGTLELYRLGVRYTPRPDFVGKDSFGYLRHSIDHRTNRPITHPVMIEVTVEPK